jgi:hypothetical protein
MPGRPPRPNDVSRGGAGDNQIKLNVDSGTISAAVIAAVSTLAACMLLFWGIIGYKYFRPRR